MPESLCLKWTYGHPGIDYRVDLLFTRYLTAIGIIPGSLKSIGQFQHAEINEKVLNVSYGWTDGRTDHTCRNTAFLKIQETRHCIVRYLLDNSFMF